MLKRLTYEEVYKRFKDKGYILLENEYISNSTKMNCIDEYGYKYFIVPMSIQAGNLPEPFNKANPYSYENMKLFFKKEGEGSILLSEKYSGSRMKIKATCKICGEETNKNWSNFFYNKNFKCLKCNHDENFKDIKYDIEFIKKYFYEKGYEITDSVYIGNNSLINCVDPDGYKVRISYSNLNTGRVPNRFSLRYNKENYIYNINNYFKINKIECEALYYIDKIAYDTYNTIICKCNCGENFETCWSSIKSGKIRCQNCSSKMSNIENKIVMWLNDRNIKYITQYTFENCKVKRNLRFDFYLPEYNEIIECDGIQHFEPVIFSYDLDAEKQFIKTKRYDKIKTNYCRENKIKLLRISYKDIKNSERYKEILLNEFVNV